MRLLFLYLPMLLLGLSACEKKEGHDFETFEGSIQIDASNELTQLQVLKGVKVITGSLVINETSFTDLSMLAEVEEIRGSLVISNNTYLRSAAGMTGLQKLSRLEISGNAVLDSISGFGHTEITYGIDITLSDRIRYIGAFESVRTLNKLTLFNLGQLQKVDFLPNLTRVTEFFQLKECVRLNALHLPALGQLEGRVQLWRLDSLTSLEGLPNLNSIKGDIMIFQLFSLQSLKGLQDCSLTPARSFTLRSCADLPNLDGLKLRYEASPNGVSVDIRNNYKLGEACALKDFLMEAGSGVSFSFYGNLLVTTSQKLIADCP